LEKKQQQNGDSLKDHQCDISVEWGVMRLLESRIRGGPKQISQSQECLDHPQDTNNVTFTFTLSTRAGRTIQDTQIYIPSFDRFPPFHSQHFVHTQFLLTKITVSDVCAFTFPLFG
jgi:hypothetical protein